MKNCTGCRFAEWGRTKSGALHPSGSGRCRLEVELPKLPASRYWVTPPMIGGGFINRRDEPKEHCPFFNRLDTKP